MALGDVHGHYGHFIELMTSAKVCDSNGTWTAHNTILMQTGDIFDRHPYSFRVLRTIMNWHQTAPFFGSMCLMNMGNHEATHIDPRGIVMPTPDGMHPAEIERFGGMHQLRSFWFNIHEYGQFLRHLPVIRVIGNSLFVHAGLSPITATELNGNISEINEWALRYFRDRLPIGHYLEMVDDCYWTRELMDHTETEEICMAVTNSLDWIERFVGFPVVNMVIGHNTKPRLTVVECREGVKDGKLWYIDAGLCHGRGGYWEQIRDW